MSLKDLKKEDDIKTTTQIKPRERPETLTGMTQVIQTGCGKIYITINEDDKGRAFEVFTSMGKSGGCAASQSEAVGRLVSLALRSNIDIRKIERQLKGISCHQHTEENGEEIRSCSDAIGKALETFIQRKQKI